MWVEVSLIAPAAEAEALADALLAAGALSTGLEDADAGTPQEEARFGEPGAATQQDQLLWRRSRVTALFAAGADANASVLAAASELGLQLPPPQLRQVAEQDWVRLTQSQFEPICISPRLWIIPSWSDVPDPDAINLRLDPGLAFGTGAHPTTHLCLQWLEAVVTPAVAVLDYGCGSGILAIAAARLGAGRVDGVDIDAAALVAAADNARNNDVNINLSAADAAADGDAEYDLVVANILTNPLKVLAPLLTGRLRDGGRLALAGVLTHQAEAVISAYAPLIQLEIGAEIDGWVRLEGAKLNRC